MTTAIGKRISKARKNAGLEAGVLAMQAGVKKETLDRWETGKAQPRANKMLQLASMLGVSPIWLMTGVVPAAVSQTNPIEPLEHIERKLERLEAIQKDSGRLLSEIIQDLRDLRSSSN